MGEDSVWFLAWYGILIRLVEWYMVWWKGSWKVKMMVRGGVECKDSRRLKLRKVRKKENILGLRYYLWNKE